MPSWIPCVLALVLAAAPAAAEDRTEHLHLEWVEGTAPETVARARAEGERFYAAVRDLLGHDAAGRVVVLLRGPAEQPDGSYDYPRVDPLGRIHLFTYDGNPDSYFSALAHEMVHVFRFSRRAEADWFFEEGLAEFVALEVDSSLAGFPWYGYPVDVVAGQWVARDEDVPLAVLRDRHGELNRSCRLQGYAQRASFFRYLAREHGRDAVLAMAGDARAGDPEDYAAFLGASFDTVAAAWRADALARYAAWDGGEAAARRYREESPAQYFQVCRDGEGF